MQNKGKFVGIFCIVVFIILTGSFSQVLANSVNENTLTITAGNTVSDDSNGSLSLVRFSGTLGEDYDNSELKKEWVNYVEGNGEEEPGNSRLTFKVDKSFISDDDNYYDISLEYYDAGIAAVLLQTSTDENNSMDYGKTGYGGYVEDPYWTWSDNYYFANLNFNLTATNTWKTYTFRVTDEFFEDNVDNYIHFYFGREPDFNDVVRVRNVVLTKRSLKIDSTDKNATNNEPLIGNIYADDNFGMGFSVYNASDETQNVTLSYKVIDSNGNTVYTKNCGTIALESKRTQKIYIDSPDKYGTYDLIVTAVYDQGIVEEEEIKFSKIPANLISTNNKFLGINSFFGYSGWTNDRQIKDAVDTGKQLGINDIRTNIIGPHLTADINSDYNNELGRYEWTYDPLFETYNQDILFTVHPDGSTDDEILQKAIDTYERIARKYGDKIEYYEILNEINLVGESWFGMSAEDYAEVLVKSAIAIKAIDSDAKIVGIDSNRIPIYEGNNYSTYSLENSWMAQVLNKSVDVDLNEDGVPDSSMIPLEVIDVISVHPYPETYTLPPEASESMNTIDEQLNDLRAFIEAMKDKNNVDKEIPIWITEFGYQTSELYGVTEEYQAAYITRFLIWSLANTDALDIEKVYIYALQDTGFTNVHDGGTYGIIDSFKGDNLKGYERDVEMAAKKSYVTVNNYSYLLNGAQPVASNEATVERDGYYRYEFEKEDENQTIIVVWNNDETIASKNVTLNVSHGSITIYDICGNIVNEFANGKGNMNVGISYNPIYIVISKDQHVLVKTEAKEATTTEEGNIAYWTCQGCGKLFSDVAGRGEITQAATKIPIKGSVATYTLRVIVDGQSVIIAKKAYEAVTLNVLRTDFQGWKVEQGNVTIKDNMFIMPPENVVISAIIPTEYLLSTGLQDMIIESNQPVRTEVTINLSSTSGNAVFNWLSNGMILSNTSMQSLRFVMPYNEVKLNANGSGGSVNETFCEVSFDSNGGSAVASKTVKVGTGYGTLDTPTKPGYIFAGWYKDNNSFNNQVKSNTIVATKENHTLYAKWTSASGTAYKVEHYKEGTDGSYVIDNTLTETKTGTTGAPVTAGAKVISGYTENTSHASRVASGTIAADGSLVLKLYYERNSYTMTFDSNGGTAVAAITQKHGTTVTVGNPTKTGYTFAGWNPTLPSTMPIGDGSYTAQWTAGSGIVYKVEHYKEGADGTYAIDNTLTENNTGTTGESVTATAKIIEGYTENTSHGSRVASGTVAANGSLVLKLYYERNSYTMTFDSNGGSAVSSITQKHGTTVTVGNPTKTGYTFAGWSPTLPFTMPINGGSYTAQWTFNGPPKVSYNGRYINWEQKGKDKYYYLELTSNGTLKFDTSATVDVFMIGGGGGGGNVGGYGSGGYHAGGGGGGGGYRQTLTNQNISAGTPYTITIGAGGAERTAGEPTKAFNKTANGGNGGYDTGGGAGGSAGGTGGTGWNPVNTDYKPNYKTDASDGTDGVAGVYPFGDSSLGTTYGAGGGGGGAKTCESGEAGDSSAGNGGGNNAPANRGGGGGGAQDEVNSGTAGSGGSGIVILRFKP